jgi:perosamine synthetase
MNSNTVQTRPATPSSGARRDRFATAKNAASWPFWKTIPRFGREYHARDLLKALKAVASSPQDEATGLETYFPTANSFHFARSGKECLYLILRCLGLRNRARVGVPLYCCEAVFAAISEAGHIPVFLDIDLNSYGFDEESLWSHRNDLDALIVVHTFGYPANLTRIQECLGDRDIPVIEDCAHSLFSEYLGAPTGSWTQASFLTFGVHKPASAGGGGMLVMNNPALASAAAERTRHLRAESKSQEVRHSLVSWARSLCYQRGVYGALLASVLAKSRDAAAGEGQSGGLREHRKRAPASRIRLVDRILIGERVSNFQSSQAVLARNTAGIRKSLLHTSLAIPEEPSYGTWNHFMLPVRYENSARCRSARTFLLKKRIDTSPLYRNCVHNARRYGYYGGCPQAECAAETACTVPNHAWLSEEELEHICIALRLSAETS